MTSEPPQDDRVPEWPPPRAAPGTLLGQLQRGLGSGARAVLAGADGAAHEVLAAISIDWRWDRQLDSRADFYARLVRALSIEIAAGDELLRSHADRTPAAYREREPIALEVLGRLSEMGDPAATAALRREATSGRYRAEATCYLEPTPVVFDESEQPETSNKLDDRPYADRSTAWLLAYKGRDDRFRRAVEVAGRSADLDLLIRAAADPTCPNRDQAVRGLREHRRLEVLPVVLELNDRTEPARLRRELRWAFSALPWEVTRDTAREWLSSSDQHSRRCTAAYAYGLHAGSADAEFLRAMLDRELDLGESAGQGLVCDLADALARGPRGRSPELRRAFREMTDSFGRRFVAKALAELDSEFSSTLAVDCLWDAEERTREIGASVAALDVPGVRGRLQELAADEYEAAEVRAAAQARTSALHGELAPTCRHAGAEIGAAA